MPEPGQQLELPAHPASVATARHLVREVVLASATPELSGDAELLTSEVVTNALVHAGAPIQITASVVGSGVRVEVADGSPHSPIVRQYGELAGTGRGLRMLDLLARWGVEATPTGKAVWFELGETRGRGAATTAPDHSDVGRAGSATGPDLVEVTLLQVPLLLHAAWQMHAESFLREYLLTQLDESDDFAAVVAHADASDALALLKENIPAPDLGEHPTHLMDDATGPKVSAARLTFRLPRSSVPHFTLLDDMLDSALGLAEAGGFLTPTIQPELRAMRRWLCSSVEEQARGESPRPWSLTSGDLDAPGRAATGWDDGEVEDVERSTSAVLVADDTNLILAANAAALRLLGYPEGELVGRRLIAIIPERFHQAHLAGFTMHLLSGRGPLIGVPVAVPAVREDGTELTVELTVRRLSTSTGRPLFVAELTDAA